MARIPTVAFKGVTKYFQRGKEFYSPTMGITAIEIGLIHNLRFYGNFTPAYKIDSNGTPTHHPEHIRDTSNDPIWKVLYFLFPSPAGNLATETESPHNFGKHVKSPATIALLLNYTYQLRETGEYTPFQQPLTQAPGPLLPQKTAQKQQKEITLPKSLSIFMDVFKEGTTRGLFTPTQDQQTLLADYEIALLEKSKTLTANDLKKFKTTNKINLNPPQIEAYMRDQQEKRGNKAQVSPPLQRPKNTDPLETLEAQIFNSLDVTEATHKTNLKKEIKELIKWITQSIHDEKDSIYPLYTTEQIILAFFCEKFNTQKSIRQLLKALDNLDTTHGMMQGVGGLNVDEEDLLKEEDLPLIAQNRTPNLDDVYLLANADFFERVTPYKPGTQPISNGSTWPYDRANEVFLKDKTFPDCVEEVLRHICNLLFYNPITRAFDLPEATPKNLVLFYKKQPYLNANTGDISMRSLWNSVIGDLNSTPSHNPIKIFYGSGNPPSYDLDPGYINIINVFRVLFGLDIQNSSHSEKDNLKLLDLEQASLEKLKEWVEAYLDFIFTTLNPGRRYDFDTTSLTINQGRTNKDVFGDVAVTVSDRISENPLFSFTISLTPGHGELINLKSIYASPTIDYRAPLKAALNCIEPKTSQASLSLLANQRQDLPLLYGLYSRIIQDNISRIETISWFANPPLQAPLPFLEKPLIHLLSAMNWDDTNTAKRLSPLALKLARTFPEIMKQHVKRLFFVTSSGNVSIPNDVIETFSNIEDLKAVGLKQSELSLNGLVKLKKLDISRSAIQTLPGLDTCSSLEHLNIIGTKNLEELALTGLSNLKTLNMGRSFLKKLSGLEDCQNLEEIYAYEMINLLELPLMGLKRLKVINLSQSAIQRLPGLETCHALEQIDASKTTGLIDLPLIGLTSLTMLDISHSAIQRLPGLETLFPLKILNKEGTNID